MVSLARSQARTEDDDVVRAAALVLREEDLRHAAVQRETPAQTCGGRAGGRAGESDAHGGAHDECK